MIELPKRINGSGVMTNTHFLIPYFDTWVDTTLTATTWCCH